MHRVHIYVSLKRPSTSGKEYDDKFLNFVPREKVCLKITCHKKCAKNSHLAHFCIHRNKVRGKPSQMENINNTCTSKLLVVMVAEYSYGGNKIGCSVGPVLSWS